MAVLLFKLAGVPDDEAGEVRVLLEQHEIDFYETPGGGWGLSAPAIWLPDERQWSKAKTLLEDYQQQRAVRVRAEWAAARAEGRAEGLLQRILHQPLRFVLFSALALFILYISLSPFLHFGR